MKEIDLIVKKMKERFIEQNDTSSLALLMELQQVLFESQQKQADPRTNLSLSEEKLTFKEGSYYKDHLGPYCPNCWDNEGMLVLLAVTPRRIRKGEHSECPNCGLRLINK